MSNIKEIAEKLPMVFSARKIANSSQSVVNFFNFYHEVEGHISSEDFAVLEAYLETLKVKETVIISVDTLNPEHLIKAYEDFLLHPNQEYCKDGDYLEFLTQVMEWLCAENVTFGSSEGDGACIGYWKIEDEDNS